MKNEFRTRFRAMLAAMSDEEITAKSAEATRRLVATKEYRKAQVVMVFLSLPREVDTTQLVLHAWQQRKRVAAPRVSWEQRRMLPIEINSLSDDIAETRFGLHEPVRGLPIPISEIDLVIVPGLAFDELGNRLGRGRGFYDRFLSNPDFRGSACAFAFDKQLTGAVPAGPLDRQVDMLVTDLRVLRFRRNDS
jgi:5-formyltetrahydrofolate cyclo-ligase